MLQPKKTKYRRPQKGRMKDNTKRGSEIAFGSFALKTLDQMWLTGRQIEAARQAITRYMKREGQLWIRVFPDKPVTSKPAETRQGSGKGAVDHWVCVTKPGKILFEIAGIKEDAAKEAMRLASHKLPIPTRFVRRDADIGD